MHVFRRFLIAASGLVLAVSTPASAQLGGAAMLGELGRHDYLHRDLVLIAQGLGLDDSQRLIVDALFEDYRDRFDAGWERTNERLANLHVDLPDMDPSNVSKIMDVVMAPLEDWQREKRQLRDRFETDVRAILNPQQSDRWPRFMQQMTREKTLHHSQLTGENLNLFHIVNDLRLTERALMDLEPVMNQYADELDAALRARNAIIAREQTDVLRSLRRYGSLPRDTNPSQELNARVVVRDTNLRYVDLIAERLPDEHVGTFRQRAMEAANPRVFRPLPAMRTITRALELEDIDENTRAAVQDIRDMFEAELVSSNARLHRVMLEFEPRQLLNRAEMWVARQEGEHVDRLPDPTRDLFAERNQRGSYYLEQLRSLLTPEQLRMLPGGTERVAERRVGERRRFQPDGGGRDIGERRAPSRGSRGAEAPARPTRDGAPSRGGVGGERGRGR